MHCKAMTPQNVVSAPASAAASCAMLMPTNPPGSRYDGRDAGEEDRWNQPQCGEEEREELCEREQAPGNEGPRRYGKGAEDSGVTPVGERVLPDHDRDESGRDHGERQQHETIGGNGRAERSGLVPETRVFLDEDTGERQGGRGYEDDAPDHELYLRKARRHEVALEQPDEERPGEEPDLSHSVVSGSGIRDQDDPALGVRCSALAGTAGKL